MIIDYDDYTNMSQNELNNLQKHIASILKTREVEITKNIKNFDLPGLKKSLSQNIDQDLPFSVWLSLNFSTMTYKDIDFFLYVKNLPNYKDKEQENKIGRKLTYTQTAIAASLNDEILFDYFINHPEFSPLVKDVIDKQYLFENFSSKISFETLDKLYQKDLLPNVNQVFESALKQKNINYINYFIKKNLFEISLNTYKDIYLNHWSEMNNETFGLVIEKFIDYKNLSFEDMINQLHDNRNKYDMKIRQFLQTDTSIFIRTLKNHKLNENDIEEIISGFDDIAPEQNEKFQIFTNLIATDLSEHIDSFKNHNNFFNTTKFREEYEKAVESITLKVDLEKELKNKGYNNNKKLKV